MMVSLSTGLKCERRERRVRKGRQRGKEKRFLRTIDPIL